MNKNEQPFRFTFYSGRTFGKSRAAAELVYAWFMKPEYMPKTVDQKLGYLVEECGEVLAAVGKTQRWGLESVNPTSRAKDPETNREWILRELTDLERAIGFVRKALSPEVVSP